MAWPRSTNRCRDVVAPVIVKGASLRELKDKVFASYGMQPSNDPCPCEVDHFVPLELGGSNDEENLWPQSYLMKPWNALVKDKLEDRLHSEVCKGETGLKNAQEEIRADWKKAYQKRFGNP